MIDLTSLLLAIPADALIAPGNVILAGCGVGVIVATIGHTLERAARLEDELAAEAAREALESVPRLEDPLVREITGEIEVVVMCPHLGTLDILDGRRCRECS